SGSENLPDIVEDAGVGGRVGPGGAADGRLIDVDHLVQVFDPRNVVVIAGNRLRLVQPARQRLEEHFVDQGAFPRTGDAGDADEQFQRNAHVDVLQVVFPGSA